MKIALLSSLSSIHTVRWANAFAGRGHEVFVIACSSNDAARDLLCGKVHVHLLPFPLPFGYFLNAGALRKVLCSVQPDILNVHFASGYGTLGRLSGFAPYVLSVWGSDVYDFPCRSPLHRHILKKNLLAANALCSTSRVMAEQTRLLCTNAPRIEVTPFGVDTALFKPLPGFRSRDEIVIGTVKTLEPKYGIDTLLRAFAYLRNSLLPAREEVSTPLRLMIVGDGPLERELAHLAKSLRIDDACVWTGAVPHEKVPEYLNRLNIYAALSRMESFGVAVLEASACGLPVVVSDVGGLPEVVLDGETGFVVGSDSPEEAGEALLELVQNEELRARMGKSGVNHVKDNYEWEESVSVMEDVFSSVCFER